MTAPKRTTWDVVVVGAGPSGTLAAERLGELGHRVLLLDAGPRLRRGEPVPEADRRAWAWRTVGLPADWYRVRAVGGRALLWGGWSHRFTDHGLRRGGWPYGARALGRYYAEVERRIGVREGALDPRYEALGRALDLRVVPKRGALPPGGRLWTPLRHRAARRAQTLSVALRLEHAAGRGVALEVLDLNTGATGRLAARAFVLAMSPVETARVLLRSELGARGRGVGRGLVDHMVASYLLLEPAPPRSARGRGPFPGDALVESFVNDAEGTERPYPGGFSVELRGPSRLDALGVERMVPGDDVERYGATLLHALGEVAPHPRRFVDLDPAERDAFGRPAPRVRLAWGRTDRLLAADLKRACVRIADALAVPGSRLVPFRDPLLFGGGHEAGTCAMGRDERAPCDPSGGLRALRNVWVADASAMPSAGDRHPTLTLLAHALRAADAVARALARAAP
ncbi:MAG: GMC family oxidoreductase [Deltaproteobacteria bacterium]|nr:GMC family oxidoreductase [Deltaproteobacteria bacterium]